jgi:hypothetical protein
LDWKILENHSFEVREKELKITEIGKKKAKSIFFPTNFLAIVK